MIKHKGKIITKGEEISLKTVSLEDIYFERLDIENGWIDSWLAYNLSEGVHSTEEILWELRRAMELNIGGEDRGPYRHYDA